MADEIIEIDVVNNAESVSVNVTPNVVEVNLTNFKLVDKANLVNGLVPENELSAYLSSANILNKLEKGGYTGTAQDLENQIVAAVTGVQGVTIKPSSAAIGGTGVASFIIIEAGTYTNNGGFVLPANSIGVIARDASNVLTFSFTAFDFTNYVKTEDIKYVVKADDDTREFTIEDEFGNKIFRIRDYGDIEFIFGDFMKDQLQLYPNTTNGKYEILDADGNTAFIVQENGDIDFNSLGQAATLLIKAISGSGTLTESLKSALQLFPNITDGQWSVKDEDGNTALRVQENGDVDFNSLGEAASLLILEIIKNNVIPTAQTKVDFDFADVNHIINYGQSLSVGQTEVVISNDFIYGNMLTFGGSVLTSAYSEDYPGNLTSFTSLKERTYTATSQLKETPTTGIVEKFYKDILKSKRTNNTDLKILGSAPGQGASTVAQLSKGGSFYPRVIADVTAGINVSNGLGKTYKCYAVTWTQGESDYLEGTTKAVYKSLMKQLSIDLNTDIKALTGQSEDIRFITYQTATINNYATTPTIALAQFELGIEDDNIIEMATSMHFMEYNDTFHLKSASSKLMGVYYGKALGRKSTEPSFKPIHPIGHLIRSNNVELNLYVPVAPLNFQSLTTSSTITNQGFQVIKATVDILTSVEIMADGITVKLLCSQSPVGASVRYGFQKAVTTANTRNMGFMKDSEGLNNKVTISSLEYSLDNWSPFFEYNI
jgi:hypothetical protein